MAAVAKCLYGSHPARPGVTSSAGARGGCAVGLFSVATKQLDCVDLQTPDWVIQWSGDTGRSDGKLSQSWAVPASDRAKPEVLCGGGVCWFLPPRWSGGGTVGFFTRSC